MPWWLANAEEATSTATWRLLQLANFQNTHAKKIYETKCTNWTAGLNLPVGSETSLAHCKTVAVLWQSEDRAPWYILTMKANEMHYFLNFILAKNSTCFGQIYCPSSGILIPYAQQLEFVILVILSAIVVTMNHPDLARRQYDKYLLLCIQCWDSWWWTVDDRNM